MKVENLCLNQEMADNNQFNKEFWKKKSKI